MLQWGSQAANGLRQVSVMLRTAPVPPPARMSLDITERVRPTTGHRAPREARCVSQHQRCSGLLSQAGSQEAVERHRACYGEVEAARPGRNRLGINGIHVARSHCGEFVEAPLQRRNEQQPVRVSETRDSARAGLTIFERLGSGCRNCRRSCWSMIRRCAYPFGAS